MPAGKMGLQTLLSVAPKTEVVAYSNDTAAMGGVNLCLESGMRIPHDLAIAGFSGLRMARCLPQPLTTIRTRRRDIGKTAARNILKRLSDTPVERKVDFGFELIKGQSA